MEMYNSKYRVYLRDTVEIFEEFITSNGEVGENKSEILHEINQVYENSNVLELISYTLKDTTKDSVRQYAEILSIIHNYENDLFNQL